MSLIPANTQIEKAELSLYTFNNFIGYQGRVLPNGPKTLHVITTPWEEEKVTWQYPPEFDETPIDTSYEDKIKVWEHFDVTQYVNDILSGKRENLGLLIKQVPTFDARAVPSTGIQMYSSEYSLVEMRPKLTIYTDNGTGSIVQTVQNTLPVSGRYGITIYNARGQIVDVLSTEDLSTVTTMLSERYGSNVYVIQIRNSLGEVVQNFVYKRP